MIYDVYAVVVNRGNMQTVFPLDDEQLYEHNGATLAHAAAYLMAQLMAQVPADVPDKPISPFSRTQMILEYKSTGEYLKADINLKYQFEGKWEMVELPEALRPAFKGVREVPSIELELADSSIIVIR